MIFPLVVTAWHPPATCNRLMAPLVVWPLTAPSVPSAVTAPFVVCSVCASLDRAYLDSPHWWRRGLSTPHRLLR